MNLIVENTLDTILVDKEIIQESQSSWKYETPLRYV